MLGVGLTILQRWQLAVDGVGLRKCSFRCVAHLLLAMNLICSASDRPDRACVCRAWVYIGSELSCYRVIHAHAQLHRYGQALQP